MKALWCSASQTVFLPYHIVLSKHPWSLAAQAPKLMVGGWTDKLLEWFSYSGCKVGCQGVKSTSIIVLPVLRQGHLDRGESCIMLERGPTCSLTAKLLQCSSLTIHEFCPANKECSKQGYGWVCAKLCCQNLLHLESIRMITSMYVSLADLFLIHCMQEFSMVGGYMEILTTIELSKLGDGCLPGTGAYERRSREGACNSSSIQIQITYIFPFWWGAMRVMQSVTYFRMRLHEKKNYGRIASTRHSDSDSTDVQKEIQVESEPAPKKRCPRKTWQRFIGVLKGQSSRDTSCNRSLCVANEASSERWGAPASSSLTRLWGRPLSPSPVRLSTSPRLDERAFWASVKLCTSLLRNMWVFMSSLWRLIGSVFLIWKFTRK